MAGGMKSKFERNLSGNSTYKCGCCRRLTRDTGIGEAHVDLCGYCYEAAGYENERNDGYIDDDELAVKIAELNRAYGARAHVGCVNVTLNSLPDN